MPSPVHAFFFACAFVLLPFVSTRTDEKNPVAEPGNGILTE
jgi:hypothetical protein